MKERNKRIVNSENKEQRIDEERLYLRWTNRFENAVGCSGIGLWPLVFSSCDMLTNLLDAKECEPDIESVFVKSLRSVHRNSSYHSIVLII